MTQPTDHDILIEIKNDVKHLVANFATHVKDDQKQWDKLDKINIKIATWTGIGSGVGVIAGFFLKALIR